ncbi:MAG: protease modulator HflC [Alphaproteobacteria bacterium]|nr:protease modulator HflC [Alphaproteobacteria bacterium]
MNRLTLAGVVAAVALFVAFNTFFVVDQAQQALVVELGNPGRIIREPGLAMKVPFFQNVIFFSKRVLVLPGESGLIITQDRKNIIVDAFARYRISDPLQFYKSVRGTEDMARARLTPVLNASLRRVLGEQQFRALLSGERSVLMRAIRDEVSAGAKTLGVEIVDVRIQRSDLPESNLPAVFQRMRAERQRVAEGSRAEGDQKAQEIRSTADKEATVIKATAQQKADIFRGEGEAERNRILGDAYGRDPEFFSFYRSLQAYEEAMSGETTTMVLSPDNPFFKYFQKGQTGGR